MIPLWDVRPDQQQYLPQQLLCNPMFRYILGWLKNLNWKFTLDLGNLRLTDIITVSLYLFDLLYTYGNQSQTQSAAYRLFKVIIHHRFSFIFLLQVLSDNILHERREKFQQTSRFQFLLNSPWTWCVSFTYGPLLQFNYDVFGEKRTAEKFLCMYG